MFGVLARAGKKARMRLKYIEKKKRREEKRGADHLYFCFLSKLLLIIFKTVNVTVNVTTSSTERGQKSF